YKVEPDEDFSVAVADLEKAGIFSEFNRVICVSVSYIRWERGRPISHIKSLYNSDKNEKAVLTEIHQLLCKLGLSNYWLCGHNIKEFDCPVLARRMLIHGIQTLPKKLNNYGKKNLGSSLCRYSRFMEIW
ncbi:MAG: hypothetical protein Q6K14_09620, partial [Gloeomargarita sp. GMQP_bins_44]